jgi:ribonuclease P protein component
MVPRNLRLPHGSIRHVQREGKRRETSFFILFTSEFPTSSEGKLSVVVSSKVSKDASERNRIRRAAQASLLAYKKNILGDIVAITKPSAQGVPAKKLRQT